MCGALPTLPLMTALKYDAGMLMVPLIFACHVPTWTHDTWRKVSTTYFLPPSVNWTADFNFFEGGRTPRTLCAGNQMRWSSSSNSSFTLIGSHPPIPCTFIDKSRSFHLSHHSDSEHVSVAEVDGENAVLALFVEALAGVVLCRERGEAADECNGGRHVGDDPNLLRGGFPSREGVEEDL